MKVKIFVAALGLLVLFVIVAAYLTLRDYPRMVRSAYYRNPIYGLRAVAAEHLSAKKFGESDALDKIQSAGLSPDGDAQFLLLLHEPNGEKTVIDSYLNLLHKVVIETEADAFWQVPLATGLALVEVDSGRMLYLEEDEGGSTILKAYE